MKHELNKPRRARDSESDPGSSQRILEIDTEKYQRYLDESDLTPAQKQQVIEALWSIVVNFVELGFGVHPVQQVTENHKETSDFDQDDVELRYSLAKNFRDAARAKEPVTAEE
ncbi:hypothetical protein IWQ49_006038 [Labrenzia sp. EL_126]|nr:hypothetical protein [Labrenzia sp. EL_126]